MAPTSVPTNILFSEMIFKQVDWNEILKRNAIFSNDEAESTEIIMTVKFV